VVGEGVHDFRTRWKMDDPWIHSEGTGDLMGEVEDAGGFVCTDVEHPVGASRVPGSLGWAWTMSPMYVNALVWWPSPRMVIGSPRKHWFMKIPITFRYRSPMCWRSP
jgi:hypothetical protein